MDLSLINGDVDKENEITRVDFGLISASLGSVEGDLNRSFIAVSVGDGEVNRIDVGILSVNFGVAGEDE